MRYGVRGAASDLRNHTVTGPGSAWREAVGHQRGRDTIDVDTVRMGMDKTKVPCGRTWDHEEHAWYTDETKWCPGRIASVIAVEKPMPTEPGWYAYSGGAQVMIFHLRKGGQWTVHLDNGTAHDCHWGYIEQALGVWDLVPLVPQVKETSSE